MFSGKSIFSNEHVREGECKNNRFPDSNPKLGSLKKVKVPKIPGLNQYVKNKEEAIALGKALFWDVQVSSDGMISCASCHFRAGADPRSKNSLAPGGKNHLDSLFEYSLNRRKLTARDFPFKEFLNYTDRFSRSLRSFDDVVGSQGVRLEKFHSVTRHDSAEIGQYVKDLIFHSKGLNDRRVTKRNAPTVINSAFNYRNFWDGRAEDIFNGVNFLGVRDPDVRVLQLSENKKLRKVKLRIKNASLASQAVAPPLDDIEMSSIGRTFPDIGKKLLGATVLAGQEVHREDSVLGKYSHSYISGNKEKGLRFKYKDLIANAFHSKWWDSDKIIRVKDYDQQKIEILDDSNRTRRMEMNEYSMMEYNFSLFFGLAIQLYESTLISDDAPVDRYFEGDRFALNEKEKRGMALFEKHACSACHAGPELTNNSRRIIFGAEGEPGEVVERMFNGNCEVVVYDQSFYNIGVRPTEEDLGIGANDKFGNPFSIAKLLTMNPNEVENKELLGRPYPNVASPKLQVRERVSAQGAFKVPSLRNVALTAPYFHNGGQATLRQVVEFYNRGGDFREHNSEFIDFEIGKLNMADREIDDLVAFLEALTDPRVSYRKAPFDHPQLYVPNGNQPEAFPIYKMSTDFLEVIDATGRNGGKPIKGFLDF